MSALENYAYAPLSIIDGASNPALFTQEFCDIIAMTHLTIRQWQEDIGQNDFIDILNSQPDLKTIPEYYLANDGNFFVARTNSDQIVGFVGMVNHGQGHAQLRRLAVLPSHHRQGIGSMLVSSAMAWVRRHGFTHIYLETAISENAKYIYKDHGFKVIGTTGRHDIAMEIEL